MGELQQKAMGRVEDKVNLNKMNIKEFRKGQLSGCSIRQKVWNAVGFERRAVAVAAAWCCSP